MNHITIELCAEDRARLDKITDTLEVLADQMHVFLDNAFTDKEKVKAFLEKDTTSEQDPIQMELAEIVAKASKNATEQTEESTPPVAPKTEEAPTVEEEAQPVATETAKPTVTLAQIQQKVVQLAAGFGGAKKAAVRDIINAYAKKVSDLPEDKWVEVWNKLTALESEG